MSGRARGLVESLRGQLPEFAFTYRGHRVETVNNNAWQKARVRAGLPQVRVHDLGHTLVQRLRATGVPFEDRQQLFGHRPGRITTHYSAAE
jgi:integrase